MTVSLSAWHSGIWIQIKDRCIYNVGTPRYNEQIFVNMTRQDSGSQKEAMIRSRKNSRRRQQEQVSKLMIFSLVAMIAGFIMATPLSLVLTIPAYILADKVSYGSYSYS